MFMPSKKITLVLSVCCLCGGAFCASGSVPETRDTDLIYSVGGGESGMYHQIRITPEGEVSVKDDYGQEDPEVIGYLSSEQDSELNVLLASWDLLPPVFDFGTSPCCDVVGYSITYHDRRLPLYNQALVQIASFLDGVEGEILASQPAD